MAAESSVGPVLGSGQILARLHGEESNGGGDTSSTGALEDGSGLLDPHQRTEPVRVRSSSSKCDVCTHEGARGATNSEGKLGIRLDIIVVWGLDRRQKVAIESSENAKTTKER